VKVEFLYMVKIFDVYHQHYSTRYCISLICTEVHYDKGTGIFTFYVCNSAVLILVNLVFATVFGHLNDTEKN